MKLYTVWLFLPMQQLQSKFNCIWGHTLEFMENWFLYVALLIAHSLLWIVHNELLISITSS